VAAECRGGVDIVMLHDYHLYAAPAHIRSYLPSAFLQHFIHTPWPAAGEWEHLPASIVESICGGLLANDSVVFQTPNDAANFVETACCYLEEAQAGSRSGSLIYGGHEVRIWSNPASIDATALECGRLNQDTRRMRDALDDRFGDLPLILRVDRMDPSKNIDGGFDAYARFLQLHPEWIGRVRFLALLVPSRSNVAEYRIYANRILAQVEAINELFGWDGWQPISVIVDQNRPQALAAMELYDVLLVNSRADGMNLVSKEGPILNQIDGALVLSKTAGSYHELKEGALGVAPDDLDATAAALHEALTMAPAERRRRAASLRRAILAHQSEDWFGLLLADARWEVPTSRISVLPASFTAELPIQSRA
jgi:trehalose 6-phosphate synthase